MRDAWDRGQELSVHGWVYTLHDGMLHDLDVTIIKRDVANEICAAAVKALK